MRKDQLQTNIFIVVKRMMCDKKICSAKQASKIKESHLIAEYFDSLGYIELIMDLEKHYHIVVPDEECGEHNKIKDIIKSVQKHIK